MTTRITSDQQINASTIEQSTIYGLPPVSILSHIKQIAAVVSHAALAQINHVGQASATPVEVNQHYALESGFDMSNVGYAGQASATPVEMNREAEKATELGSALLKAERESGKTRTRKYRAARKAAEPGSALHDSAAVIASGSVGATVAQINPINGVQDSAAVIASASVEDTIAQYNMLLLYQNMMSNFYGAQAAAPVVVSLHEQLDQSSSRNTPAVALHEQLQSSSQTIIEPGFGMNNVVGQYAGQAVETSELHERAELATRDSDKMRKRKQLRTAMKAAEPGSALYEKREAEKAKTRERVRKWRAANKLAEEAAEPGSELYEKKKAREAKQAQATHKWYVANKAAEEAAEPGSVLYERKEARMTKNAEASRKWRAAKKAAAPGSALNPNMRQGQAAVAEAEPQSFFFVDLRGEFPESQAERGNDRVGKRKPRAGNRNATTTSNQLEGNLNVKRNKRSKNASSNPIQASMEDRDQGVSEYYATFDPNNDLLANAQSQSKDPSDILPSDDDVNLSPIPVSEFNEILGESVDNLSLLAEVENKRLEKMLSEWEAEQDFFQGL